MRQGEKCAPGGKRNISDIQRGLNPAGEFMREPQKSDFQQILYIEKSPSGFGSGNFDT